VRKLVAEDINPEVMRAKKNTPYKQWSSLSVDSADCELPKSLAVATC
jgi:hypothetical protein